MEQVAYCESMKNFRLYTKKYHCIGQDKLFDKAYEKELLKTDIKKTTVYAIGQTKRMEFLLDTVTIGDNFDLVGKIKYGENIYDFSFDLAAYHFRKKDNAHELASKALNSVNFGVDSNMSATKKYKHLARVSKEYSDRHNICVRCPIDFVITGQKYDAVHLNIYNLINYFDVDFFQGTNIIYIGKSIKSTLNRLKNHNKWGSISSKHIHEKIREVDYAVHCFELESTDQVFYEDKDNIVMVNKKHELLNFEDEIVPLAESILIATLKPTINEQGKNANIMKKPSMIKLQENGYSTATFELDLNGMLGRIYSDFVGSGNFSHILEYEF